MQGMCHRLSLCLLLTHYPAVSFLLCRPSPHSRTMSRQRERERDDHQSTGSVSPARVCRTPAASAESIANRHVEHQPQKPFLTLNNTITDCRWFSDHLHLIPIRSHSQHSYVHLRIGISFSRGTREKRTKCRITAYFFSPSE